MVIPAYNEAARLTSTLSRLAVYFEPQPREVEILIVDDGSSDATAAVLRSSPPPASRHLRWRMLQNGANRGKGYSVRHGMTEARGRRLLFTDADLAAPIEELAKLETALDAGADIAIGSRHPELIAHRQSRTREFAGRGFNRLVRWGLGLDFHDTQCGFKLFTRAAARRIFPLQRVERWGFDPELLYLARLARLRVEEVPVNWSHVAGAKIRLGRDSLGMFADLGRIRMHAWRGRYTGLADAVADAAADPESPLTRAQRRF